MLRRVFAHFRRRRKWAGRRPGGRLRRPPRTDFILIYDINSRKQRFKTKNTTFTTVNTSRYLGILTLSF